MQNTGEAFIQHMKDCYKILRDSTHYGKQFYLICEAPELDPEEVKKGIEILKEEKEDD